MSKYQEALDEIGVQVNKAYIDSCYGKATKQSMRKVEDIVGVNIKILQELVDEKTEFESRKEKLIIGSKWECVCKTYGTVKILDAHPFSENVTFGDMIFSRTEKIDDFILCFKPLKEGEIT